jgi:hypothetical protein
MLSAKAVDKGSILVTRKLDETQEDVSGDVIMRESEFMVSTDQVGIYINEGENPKKGYVSYSNVREPCLLQIFTRGKRLRKAIPMTIVELNLLSPFRESVKVYLETKNFRPNQPLLFPTTVPANIIYLLYPGDSYKGITFLIPDILRYGFFINYRVLPNYYITNDSQYECSSPVKFSEVYQQILRVYDLIYPSSSIITPFTEEHFKKGMKFILHRMKPENWSSYFYMPSSRDMGSDQWHLLERWNEQRQAP